MTHTLFSCPIPGNTRLTARACSINRKAYREMPESYPLLHACKECPGVQGVGDFPSDPPLKAMRHPQPLNHPGAQPAKMSSIDKVSAIELHRQPVGRTPKAKTQFPKRKQKVPAQEEPYDPYIDAPCPNCPDEKQYGKSGVCLKCMFKQVGVGK